MTSDARRDWLLGDKRPVWVIPARIVEGEPDDDGQDWHQEVINAQHESCREHEWGYEHQDGVHRKTLVHPAGSGIIEVHSASKDHLEKHLDSVSVSMRSRPPGAADGPQPLFLQNLVNDAFKATMGSTVSALLRGHGEDGNLSLRSLMEAEGATEADEDIAATDAVDALSRGLSELEAAGVLSADDCSVLNPRELIAAIFSQPAAESAIGPPPDDHQRFLKADHGSVLTKLGPAVQGHDFSFSLRDVGSILAGKTKYYKSIGSYEKVTEGVKVASGKMKMTIQDYYQNGWKIVGDAPNVEPSSKVQMFCRYSQLPKRPQVWWHMKLVGRAAETSYDLYVSWLDTEGYLVSQQKWDEAG